MSKLKLYIPESWDEIKLKQYELISTLDTEDNQIHNMLRILTILCELDTKQLEEIPISYYPTLFESINWIGVAPQPKDVTSVKIKGEEYSVDPNWNKLSFGEVISIEQLLMDNTKDSESYAKVCAVLLRKKVNGKLEPFNASTVMELIPIIKTELSITEVLGLIVNFSLGEDSSTMSRIQGYLETTK